MQEIWKDIVGYEGLYQVSNCGRVKSFHYKKTIILKPGLDGKKYLAVSLNKNGKNKTIKIHRLVAKAFIPNPNNLPQVNHKDGNKSNNNVSNLEWCNQSHNIKEAYRLGLMKPQKTCFKKGQIANNKVKINQYDLDGNFIKTWESIQEASSMFCQISNHPNINISGVLRNKRKTAFGYIWKYAN